MAVKNDRNLLSIDGRTENSDNSLNHSILRDAQMHLKQQKADRKNDMSKWRKHAFNVILPRKLSEHTDNDLKLMRVSLKNAISASIVHMKRIERELKRRGSSLTILG